MLAPGAGMPVVETPFRVRNGNRSLHRIGLRNGGTWLAHHDIKDQLFLAADLTQQHPRTGFGERVARDARSDIRVGYRSDNQFITVTLWYVNVPLPEALSLRFMDNLHYPSIRSASATDVHQHFPRLGRVGVSAGTAADVGRTKGCLWDYYRGCLRRTARYAPSSEAPRHVSTLGECQTRAFGECEDDLQRLADTLDMEQGDRVLDLGCGYGEVSQNVLAAADRPGRRSS